METIKRAKAVWTGFVKNLTDDKANKLATWNETGSFWQMCEWGTGRNTWSISCTVA